MIYFDFATKTLIDTEITNIKPSADALEISKAQRKEILHALSNLKQVTRKGDGYEISDMPAASAEIVLSAVKKEVRILRDKLITRVVDIGSAAFANGNTSVASEVFDTEHGARRKLLDITDDPALNAATTREDMEAAVQAYYAAIVSNVSPEVRSAFKELEK